MGRAFHIQYLNDARFFSRIVSSSERIKAQKPRTGTFRLAASFGNFRNPGRSEDFFVFEIWDQIFVETPGFDGKYLYPLTHWYGFPGRMALWDNLFSGSGLVFYGGFLFGILFVTLYMKFFKLDIPSYLDAAVPSMAIGYAIGRLGCWVSGDGCYGFATEMRIPLLVFDYHGAHPSGVPVWNTPLIESIVSFVFFFTFNFGQKIRTSKNSRSELSIWYCMVLRD